MWRGAWLEPETEPWSSLGFTVTVLDPGNPGGRYHAESNHEVFLVVAGEVMLLVEGEERRLRQWDFFHCPPGTEHVLIGTGDRPAVVVAASARAPDASVRYLAGSSHASTVRRPRSTRSTRPRRSTASTAACVPLPRRRSALMVDRQFAEPAGAPDATPDHPVRARPTAVSPTRPVRPAWSVTPPDVTPPTDQTSTF